MKKISILLKLFSFLLCVYLPIHSLQSAAEESYGLGIKVNAENPLIIQPNQNVLFSQFLGNGITYDPHDGVFRVLDRGKYSLNAGVLTLTPVTFAITINDESIIPILSPSEVTSLVILNQGDKISLLHTGSGFVEIQRAFLQIVASGPLNE